MDFISAFFSGKIFRSLPYIRVNDVIEVIIMAILIYYIALWIKNTRAWTLLRGAGVLLVFYAVAILLGWNTIVYLVGRSLNVLIIAIVVIFQPELRRALEQLGRRNTLIGMFTISTEKQEERFTENTVNEIVKAAFDMGRVKTGALIVIENKMNLREYERTGIMLDGILTSQLLINIFEHNTPLHDGAVIVRGRRVTSATCYLPLSDNMEISKDLGTRHRAGIGISEITDSVTVIVSEETGKVSVAKEGQLFRAIDEDALRAHLKPLCFDDTAHRFSWLWKGRNGHEKSSDK